MRMRSLISAALLTAAAASAVLYAAPAAPDSSASIAIPAPGDPAALFRRGNGLYQQGLFLAALETYEAVLAAGVENGPLYYNMGNCCYKLRRIGSAVLNYERARRFMPSDQDLKANLALANLAVVDKIEPQPEFLPVLWARAAVKLVPRKTLTLSVLALYAAACAFLVLNLVSRAPRGRRLGLRGAAVSGALALFAGLLLIGRVRVDRSVREAVVTTAKVEALSAPGEQGGVEVFTLHEGTKVRLDREAGSWVEIILSDRKVGWVPAAAIEQI